MLTDSHDKLAVARRHTENKQTKLLSLFVAKFYNFWQSKQLSFFSSKSSSQNKY